MYALVVTSLLWAFSFGLIKHHLPRVDSSFVAFARLALAALLFLPWLSLRRVQLSLIARLAALGAVQFGMMYLFYLAAFQSLQAYQVVLLTIVTPIWICVIEDVLSRTVSLRPIVAALLAVLGAWIALGGSGFCCAPWRGILLVQASNACFAFGQVWYRRIRKAEPSLTERSMSSWMYLGAVFVVLPLVIGRVPTEAARLTFDESLVIVYLGVVASGVGFFLWNYGASRVSTAVLAVMNNAKTPLGLLASLIVFGESVRVSRLAIGTLVVVVATLHAQRTSTVAGAS